jgi:citrate lyase subunit beta / citryl-CoA lyase
MEETAIAGNYGLGIRSDCKITLSPGVGNGLEIEVVSKVKALFGKQIENLVKEILAFYEINQAKVLVEDAGALSFVIAARLEAAIREIIDTEKEYLLPMHPAAEYETGRDRNRISRLYLPGNSPALMINAGIHKPDGIILDLEDSVDPEKKYEARFIVRNALRSLDFYGVERMVRINQLPLGLDDLDFVIPHKPHLIILPKCESAEQIHQVNEHINLLKIKYSIKREIWLMPIIESALGVIKAWEIASAAANIVSMAIGVEDYTADIGTQRSADGIESLFACSQVINACRAAGIQPNDSVFSDVSDNEGLIANILRSKKLGFDGMGCIHPRQIKTIHEFYAPDKAEIEKAKRIYIAFYEAKLKGLGVIAVGSKMVDLPVVKRAIRTLEVAVKAGKLSPNWKEEKNV